MNNGVVSFTNVQSAQDYLRSELKEFEDCGYSAPRVPGQISFPDRMLNMISGALACVVQDISRRALDEPGSEKLERSLKNFTDCYSKIERINLAKARFERDCSKADASSAAKRGTCTSPAADCGAGVPPATAGQDGGATIDESQDVSSTTETAKPFVAPPSGGCKRSRDHGAKKRRRRDVKTATRADRRAAQQAEDAQLPLPPSYEIAREHLESNREFAEFLRDYSSGMWQPPPAHADMIAGKFNWVYRAPPGPPAVNKFADIFPLKDPNAAASPASGSADGGPEKPKYRKPTRMEISNAIGKHFFDFITYHVDKMVDNPHSPEYFAKLYAHWHARYIAKYGGAELSPADIPFGNNGSGRLKPPPAQDAPAAIDHAGNDP